MIVTAEYVPVTNVIRLTGTMDRATQDIARSVAGARYNVTGPCYDYAASVATCRALRAAFGQRLRLGPKLRKWARARIEAEARLGELAAADDAELFNVCDRIDKATAARSYQRVAAGFIADVGSCLIADQPGLGKCIELLAGVQEADPDAHGGLHLIFAPLVAVEAVWPGEIAHWCGAENAVAFPIRGTREQRTASLEDVLSFAHSPAAAGLDVFVVCNIEMARIPGVKNEKGKIEFHVENAHYPILFSTVWDYVVADESHRALIKTGKPTQTRVGLTKLRSRVRIALSGTPMRGKPIQLWGTLNWLRPDLYPSYWRWVETYWQVGSSRWSKFVIGDFQPGGEDRLAADLRPIMLRRTKAEVLPELPPKQYAGTYLDPDDDNSPLGVWLEMTPEQQRRYDEFVENGTVELHGGWVITNGALAERVRRLQLAASEGRWNNAKGEYRHALPSPKFDWLAEFIESLDGERVIVSSYSTDLLNVFADGLTGLGVAIFLLTGDTPAAERAKMQQDFQSEHPSASVFLLNAKAGGIALTLDMADYLVMLDESTIPDDDEQVEDRAHRTSRMHQLTIYKLRMLGTLEEEIAWIAAARENVQRYILDGSRGVEYARSVYRDAKASNTVNTAIGE